MTWTPTMRAEARFMYEKQDAELEEIAEKLGKTVVSIRMVLVKMGIYEKKSADGVDYKKLFKSCLDSCGLAIV